MIIARYNIRYNISVRITLLLFAIAVLTNLVHAELPAKENLHLFLLVGQSNMAGRGKIDAANNKPHPRVVTLNQQNVWVSAIDPLHFDKPNVVGVGLGKTFAEVVAEANPDVVIGLIPCAVGGSPIDTWRPGAFDKPTNSHPWDDAIKRAHLALESGTLKGILWHQGESDSSAELAASYEQKLHDLIARFRKELHAPEVPFVIGQLGQFPERPWNAARQTVNNAHQEIAEHIAHTAFVKSDGLTHNGDNTHFNSESYQEFGRRFAAAYLSHVNADTLK